MRMTSLEEKLQIALYIERYAEGHQKGCPLSIPEIRATTFRPKCICEEWRAVVDFEGYYEVSSLGRVRRSGNFNTNSKQGHILASKTQKEGYISVCLCVDNQKYFPLVHQLVAAAFIGKCPPGHEVNHKDLVKSNNRADNLEYKTPKENTQHAIEAGVFPVGERNGRFGNTDFRGSRNKSAKLTEAQVLEIKQKLKLPYSVKAIADEYKVDNCTIQDIKQGRHWNWLEEVKITEEAMEKINEG